MIVGSIKENLTLEKKIRVSYVEIKKCSLDKKLFQSKCSCKTPKIKIFLRFLAVYVIFMITNLLFFYAFSKIILKVGKPNETSFK